MFVFQTCFMNRTQKVRIFYGDDHKDNGIKQSKHQLNNGKTIICLLFFSEHKILLEMQLLSAHITLSFTTNFTFYCHSVWKLASAKSGRYINLFVHYCICSLQKFVLCLHSNYNIFWKLFISILAYLCFKIMNV